MESRTVKKLNLSLLIACLIGGVIGFIAAEAVYGYTQSEWLPVFATGLYFLMVAFCIFLFGLVSEIITGHMRGGAWNARQTGIGIIMVLLMSIACLAAGIVFQFIYGLGMTKKTLTNIQDYIILIDNSGSTSSTDPDEERFSSVLNMVSTLGADNNVSVKVFDDTILGTFPMESVTPDMQNRLSQFFAQFDSSGGTDMQLALMEAINEYTPNERSAAVLLLSDGESSVDLDLLTNAYNAKGTPIYCLGFSGNGISGSRLLEKIASGTDGYYYEINELSDLTQAVDKMISLANRRMLLGARRGSDRNNTLAMVLRILFTTVLGVLTGVGVALACDSSVILTRGMILHSIASVLAGLLLEFGLQMYMPSVLIHLLMCILFSLILVPYLKTVYSDDSFNGSGSRKGTSAKTRKADDAPAKDLRKRNTESQQEKSLL